VTKNITLKVDAGVYQRAREIAAAGSTSVSAMVGTYLSGLTGKSPVTDSEYKRRAQRLKKLWIEADRRDAKKAGAVGPFPRDDAYAGRVH